MAKRKDPELGEPPPPAAKALAVEALAHARSTLEAAQARVDEAKGELTKCETGRREALKQLVRAHPDLFRALGAHIDACNGDPYDNYHRCSRCLVEHYINGDYVRDDVALVVAVTTNKADD